MGGEGSKLKIGEKIQLADQLYVHIHRAYFWTFSSTEAREEPDGGSQTEEQYERWERTKAMYIFSKDRGEELR